MMSMELDLAGLFDQNETYSYDDYEYKEDMTPRRRGAVLLPLLYSVVSVVGLLGNGLVLAVLARRRRSWSISDTFILHLSVADVLLLLTLPFRAALATGICDQCLIGFLCKISGALFNINFYCGIYLLFCISLDRYLSIVHAIQLFSQKRPRLAHISCLVIWIGSLILTIPDWIFLVAKKYPEQQITACAHDYPQSPAVWWLVSRLPHHTLGFLLPAAALIICCSGILLWLQRSAKGLQKQRSIMVILPLVVVFFLFWVPYNITLIVDTARGSTEDPEHGLFTALIVTSALGCLHACLRPLLYLGLCGNFRAQTLATLRRAAVESAGSLWGLGVGEKALPDQSHDREEVEQMTNVDHQVQSAQC